VIRVTAYTDGGCRGNPGGIGGWGAILINDDTGTALELWGSAQDTTNNRMELQAAIEALAALKQAGTSVRLHSDSQYVIKGMTEWISGWKSRGWRTASKQPVLNREYWERLDELSARHHVTWHWVKGHSGHVGNDRVDALANEAMDALRDGKVSSGERRTRWTL
jgi:ribonuclease HI